jgi:DNA-binding transcriptional MerR regulator
MAHQAKTEALMQELLTKSDAAKILGLAPATVVLLEKQGKLSAQRTASGVRLFSRPEVERLAAERKAAAAFGTRA